jgi:mono/diheme cytochrome c family protein
MLRLTTVLLFTTSAFLTAQEKELTGKPYIDMDYGPALSMTIEADGPGKNIAYKGVMVTLDEETQTYALFDEDLMRYAAAWTGGKLNWRSVIYDGSHNTHPSMVGDQLFGNAVRPGWSISGEFKDPRSMEWGPLPHGVAHYKGMFLHGDKVVFHYTVGGTHVREMPGLEKVGDQLVVTRTIEVTKSQNNMTLQLAEMPGENAATIVRSGTHQLAVLGNLTTPKAEIPKPIVPTEGLVGQWNFDGGRAVKPNGAKPAEGHSGRGLSFSGRNQAEPRVRGQLTFGGNNYSIAAWVRTNRGGTIAAVTAPGKWIPGGKSLFVRDGRLTFDIGWVGAVSGEKVIADGRWHHVAVTHNTEGKVQLFVDGKLDGEGELDSRPDPRKSRLVFGRTSNDFPRGPANGLVGSLDDVLVYNRVLTVDEVAAIAPGGPTSNITSASVIGDTRNVSWRIKDSALRLHIPSSATPARIKVLQWSGPADQLDQFKAATNASPQPVALTEFTKGGPTRFEEVLTTRGKLAEDNGKAYVIDELTPPFENPWRSWLRFGGFDFFEDTTKAAICTWNGDVWIVSGINDSLEKLTWKRIATGMFQPLGVKIVNDDIYVCCRDQITLLRDLNGDGETDYYENFNNDHQVTEHFHEFAMDLQTDAKGNFYYAKSARHAKDSLVPHHGTLIKVNSDGTKSEIVCNGFRAANGVGIGPKGELSTSDQEGHWTPANRINIVRRGGFYGNMYSFHRGPRPTKYDPPVTWLPKNVDRSPAESLWVTSDKWGPLSGNLISTSYGTGQVFLVPYEQVNGVYQGGAVRFPLDFPTGTMRARFHPTDGQLYVCGLFGWSSNKTRPGGFYRVRYTGKAAHMPVEYKVASNGIQLTFSEPLDRGTATQVGNFALSQWNYRWTKNYGSAHYKVSDPKQEGHDEVIVKSATLLPDNKTVFLEIDDLQTVMQMQIAWSLKNRDGTPFENEMHATINKLGRRFDLRKMNDAPRKVVAKTKTQPGLVQRFTTGGFSSFAQQKVLDARVSRLAAVRTSSGPLSPFANGTKQTDLTGQIRISKPGRYEFRSNGTAAAVVKVRDQIVLMGKPINLSRGSHPIEVTTSMRANTGFTVEWKSETFDWEPIPPTALEHDPRRDDLSAGNGRRDGRVLFAESQCIRCHALPDSIDISNGMPEIKYNAPSLTNAGDRFQPEWLHDWILNPKQMRPDTNMPSVLHGETSEADAMDIAAYISTLGEFDDAATAAPDIKAGHILFEDLGCIACHRTTPISEDDDYDRRSLGHVNQKYKRNALSEFLLSPRKHHASRRMADFELTNAEAGNLEAWLREATPEPREFENQGDPRQGKILFGSVGCANCHAVDDRQLKANRGLSAMPSGCLAPTASQRGDAPDYQFTSEQKRNLFGFLQDGLTSLTHRFPAEAAERAIEKLNCNACHTRDGKLGGYREIFAEEGFRGDNPETVPPMTWAGEKFKTDWMAKFVSGENKTRLRPHLRIRMPRFGDYGNVIANGLAHQHAIDPNEQPRPVGMDRVAMGQELIGREGGFNCLQCHGVGDQKPTAAFDALGVNLEQIPVRIRRPFFDRWMLDPPRLDTTTKMPRLSTNGQTSIRDIAGGNAALQFDAIWQYLNVLSP